MGFIPHYVSMFKKKLTFFYLFLNQPPLNCYDKNLRKKIFLTPSQGKNIKDQQWAASNTTQDINPTFNGSLIVLSFLCYLLYCCYHYYYHCHYHCYFHYYYYTITQFFLQFLFSIFIEWFEYDPVFILFCYTYMYVYILICHYIYIIPY